MAVPKLHTIPAHYPRAYESSTLRKGQRPSLVYCEWLIKPAPTSNEPIGTSRSGHIDKQNNTITTQQAAHEIEEYVEYGNTLEAHDSKVNVLFLHGIGHSKEIWQQWVTMIEEHMSEHVDHVVALDLINHGDSWLANADKLGWFLDWSDLGRDACEVMRHVGIDSKLILIGHSMGGTAALFAALFEPGLVDSCIVLDPMCHKALEDKRPHVIIQQSRRMAALKQVLESSFESEAHFWHYFRTIAPSRKTLPQTFDYFLRSNMITHADGSVDFKTPKEQQLLAFHGVYSVLWTALDAFKSVRCPILHVSGTQSTWTHPETVPIIRDTLNCAFLDISGGHFFPFEDPARTFSAIQPFLLSRLSRKRSVRVLDRETVGLAVARAFDRYAHGITQLPAKL